MKDQLTRTRGKKSVDGNSRWNGQRKTCKLANCVAFLLLTFGFLFIFFSFSFNFSYLHYPWTNPGKGRESSTYVQAKNKQVHCLFRTRTSGPRKVTVNLCKPGKLVVFGPIKDASFCIRRDLFKA